MDAVVLGACGAMGREVTAGLVAEGTFDRVVLADLDLPRLRALGRVLGGSGGVARPKKRGGTETDERANPPAPDRADVAVRRVEGSDRTALRRAISGASVMVNCTTYRLGVPALRAAIAEGVSYLDLGGLYNTPRQLALDGPARRAGIRAVIGCGATPGLSNVLVRRAASRLDRVHEVHISFASHRDLAPSPGLLDTLLDEFRPGIPRFTWRDGRFREVGPFEGARRVRFAPPVGEQDVYYVPHSETYTIPRSLGNGLREVTVRGTWRASDMAALQALARLGLTSDRPVRVGRVSVRPLDLVRTVILAHPPREPGALWAFFLEVEVVGVKGGRPRVIHQRTSHPADWGPGATGRMTAVPAVAGAVALARGLVEGTGVMAPDVAFEPEAFVRAVRRAGVRVFLSER